MESTAGTPPLTIEQFAYRIAGPRDLVINLVINTAIPWWLFRGMDSVPLTGGHSVATILLPMTFLLSTLTTFFGYLNGITQRRAGAVLPPLPVAPAWAGRAWRHGLTRGMAGLAITGLLAIGVSIGWPTASLAPQIAIGGLGFYAGILGYVLHARAVVQSGAL